MAIKRTTKRNQTKPAEDLVRKIIIGVWLDIPAKDRKQAQRELDALPPAIGKVLKKFIRAIKRADITPLDE